MFKFIPLLCLAGAIAALAAEAKSFTSKTSRATTAMPISDRTNITEDFTDDPSLWKPGLVDGAYIVEFKAESNTYVSQKLSPTLRHPGDPSPVSAPSY